MFSHIDVGSVYSGVVFCSSLCGVSIIRRYLILSFWSILELNFMK